ncbi:MAG: choice-of-anchor D domain-containing protein [Kofleriaceae bacterium]
MQRRRAGVLVVFALVGGGAITFASRASYNPLRFSRRAVHVGAASGSGSDALSIAVAPNPIVMTGTTGVPVMGSGAITGTGSGVTNLTGAALADPNLPPVFTFIQPVCATGSCTFAPGATLPALLVMQCTPGATTKFGTVTLTGGPTTVTSAPIMLECRPTAAVADFAVSMVGPLSTPVGQTATTSVTITNTGNAMLSITLSTTSAEWVPAMCTATPCALPVAGPPLTVPIAFTPVQHDVRNATLQVDSTPQVGPKFTTLPGIGFGGVLRVDQPGPATIPAFSHDFGTIPKGQPSTFTVQMTNTGNEDITVMPSPATPPYGITGGSAGVISISGGGNGGFDVTCQSATPLPATPLTVTLGQSANTYSRNTSTLGFNCAVANTTAQIMPTPIDFGQLRVGDPESTITVTVTNPADGGGSILVKRMAFAGDVPGSLTATSPTLPMVLADGASITQDLTLTTATDVVLEDLQLEIGLMETEDVTLAIPVTGKVGTPRVVVVPELLALGTVCVNTPITGTVTMTNTGTLTLAVQRPSMNSTDFAPLFTNPTAYPDPPAGAPLLEMDAATVGIMPAAIGTPGRVTGTLEWAVDAPGSPFSVPVSVEYLASGTAVSPEAMSFGAVDLDDRSTNQIVTLENCGSVPVLVTYSGVDASSGTAGAWKLDPAGDQRLLAPDGKMQIMVAFAPRDPGIHLARIPIDVDGVEQDVDLTGNGVGIRLDKTSFYACNCSGGSPVHGWPLIVVLAFVYRRRKK